MTYDAVSVDSIRAAHQLTHGKREIPSYAFDEADVIVSFGADFLSAWIAPVHFTKLYSSRRKLKNKLSKHIQIESLMSLTGSNADIRIPVESHEEGLVLLWILKLLARLDNRWQCGQTKHSIVWQSHPFREKN